MPIRWLVLILFLTVVPGVHAQCVLVDDFEHDTPGMIPSKWFGLSGRELVPIRPSMREDGEYYRVTAGDDGQYLALRTENESLRLVIPNGRTFNWDLTREPVLTWRWRPVTMPEGASERKADDTAGAIYVTFGFDWLRRPRSIKYTHSSSLPVGTVVDNGVLQVVVVSTGENPDAAWLTLRRNVREDYRRLFGKEPPATPVSIAVWSDSDTVQGESAIDIDDLCLSRN